MQLYDGAEAGFPVLGASDVGGLTDRAARQITVDQTGKMYCLAGIGGRVEGIMANGKGRGQNPGD